MMELCLPFPSQTLYRDPSSPLAQTSSCPAQSSCGLGSVCLSPGPLYALGVFYGPCGLGCACPLATPLLGPLHSPFTSTLQPGAHCSPDHSTAKGLPCTHTKPHLLAPWASCHCLHMADNPVHNPSDSQPVCLRLLSIAASLLSLSPTAWPSLFTPRPLCSPEPVLTVVTSVQQLY